MKYRVLALAGGGLGLALLLSISACNIKGRLAGKMPYPVSEATLTNISLPPGFQIAVYADKLEDPRSLALTPAGTLFIGTRQNSKVYAALDEDKDGRAERVMIFADKLNTPNGVAFRDGALYVAEVNRILKFSDVEKSLERPPSPQTISLSYPSDAHHGWKFIRFGPDGKLYVPVGAPCNICLSTNPIFASITRLNPDGSGQEIFAHGIRNTVGFDWHPRTKELWFTDNGRDELGEDVPPDELNRAPASGEHFGYPFVHGKGIRDPEYGSQAGARKFREPEMELGPHVAALGMRFYTGRMFPEKYRGGIFIAEHGSWNRKQPLGYRVMFVKLENDRPVSYEIFAEGWLKKSFAWGRPVDVEVMPDGSLLVSDDKAGRIYRITYETP
jgi:glucose/arabinose dehydrogenase